MAARPVLADEDICEALKKQDVVFPAGDLPSAAEVRDLQGCRSEPLYDGSGVPADPVKARKCAFVELTSGYATDLVSGTVTLMMIYANGKGVRRNLDIALKLACDTDTQDNGDAWRVERLRQMKGTTSPESFDFCRDISSSRMGRICEAREERRRTGLHAAQRAAVAARLPADAQPAFAELEQAALGFIIASSSAESESCGLLMDGWFEGRKEREAGFDKALTQLQLKDFPPAATAAQLARADAALNAVYQRYMKTAPEDPRCQGGYREGVRNAQKRWLRYRDAWVRLGAKVRPEVPPEAWRAWLTQERTAMLEALPAMETREPD
jgi:uncharacterized protein YecT (DUF1311 family)